MQYIPSTNTFALSAHNTGIDIISGGTNLPENVRYKTRCDRDTYTVPPMSPPDPAGMIWCTCRTCFGIRHAPLSVSQAPEQQRFYTGPKSNPHVSLSKGVTDQWWDLGPFVKHCNDITDWQPTLNPLIHFSPSEGVYTSSLNTTTLAQRSLFLLSHSSPLSVSTLLNIDTLMHPILLLVLSPLWAATRY